MSNPTGDRSADGIHCPDPPISEDSGLTLEEYLDMQQAIGHAVRYQLLRTLVANDELSASEFADVYRDVPLLKIAGSDLMAAPDAPAT